MDRGHPVLAALLLALVVTLPGCHLVIQSASGSTLHLGSFVTRLERGPARQRLQRVGVGVGVHWIGAAPRFVLGLDSADLLAPRLIVAPDGSALADAVAAYLSGHERPAAGKATVEWGSLYLREPITARHVVQDRSVLGLEACWAGAARGLAIGFARRQALVGAALEPGVALVAATRHQTDELTLWTIGPGLGPSDPEDPLHTPQRENEG